jgi:phage tail protein X
VSEKYLTEVIKTEMMTVSQLVWRLLRRQPTGYVERVLELNRGISSQGPFLTVGSTVMLPLENIDNQSADASVIRLWD